MMIVEKCPTNEELHALSLGRLSEEESDEMLVHLQGCESCQAELGNTDPVEDTLVGHLREGLVEGQVSEDVDGGSFSDEAECRSAMAKALGALANANNQSIGDSELSNLLPRVLGEYEIVRPIGRGGMGSVYLARHSKLGRQVALKVLSSHRLMQPRMRQRFESEMRAVGQLSHPNIVTAHDAREVDEIAVLVTEFIDGLDIAQILRRTGKLSVGNACEIARQTALALQYVDEQGLVHRDIKPSNVMIGKAGEVKLLDLGLARLQLGDDERPEMTATGQAMGTADYIAPEQVNDSRQVDIRADIYALGCTLFKMVTGQPPFEDERYPTVFAKMTAHVSDSPPSIQSLEPEIPAELAKLIHRMIAKNANDRPQTPAEVAELLAQFSDWAELKQLVEQAIDAGEIAGQPLRKPSATPLVLQSEPKPFFFRRVPMLVAIASGLLGVLIGLALGIIITIKHPDGTTTQVEVPEGSSSKVAPNGDVEVQLKGTLAKENDNSTYTEMDLSVDQARAALKSDLAGMWRLASGNNESAPHLVVFVDNRLIATEQKNGKFVTRETTYEIGPQATAIEIKEGESIDVVHVVFSVDDDSTKIGLNLVEGSQTAYYVRIATLPFDNNTIATLPFDSNSIDKEAADPRNENILSVAKKILQAEVQRSLQRQAVDIHSDKDRLQGVWYATSGANVGSMQYRMVFAFHEYDAITIVNNEIAGVTTFGITQKGRFSTLRLNPPEGNPESASMEAVIQFDGDDKFTMQTTQGKVSLKRIAGSPVTEEDLTRIAEDPETILLLESVKKVAHYEKTGEFQLSEAQLSAKEAAMQARSRNNLKQIGLALHNYHDVFQEFPAAQHSGVSDKKQKVVARSWRVSILPFLGEQKLYEKFHRDEDWDSEHNIKLLDEMPDVFRAPSTMEGTNETPYLAIVGPKTVISDSPVKLREILDGTANTIMVIETKKTVPWTKPEDIELMANGDKFRTPELRPVYKDGVQALIADGSVKLIKSETDSATWNAYITRDGLENIRIK